MPVAQSQKLYFHEKNNTYTGNNNSAGNINNNKTNTTNNKNNAGGLGNIANDNGNTDQRNISNALILQIANNQETDDLEDKTNEI